MLILLLTLIIHINITVHMLILLLTYLNLSLSYYLRSNLICIFLLHIRNIFVEYTKLLTFDHFDPRKTIISYGSTQYFHLASYFTSI